MPYYKIDTYYFLGLPIGINGEKLPVPSTIQGEIDGKQYMLEIFSEEAVAFNGVVMEEDKGAVCFDPRRKQKMVRVKQKVVYVNENEAARIETHRIRETIFSRMLIGNDYEASNFGNTLEQLSIRAEEQVGLRPRGKRSLMERFLGF